MTVDLRTRYLGPRAPLADRRVGRAAQRRAGHGRAGSSDAGRRRHRPAVAVRGGDPRTRRSSSTGRSSRAPSTSPRRSTTSRRSDAFVGAADRYLAALERVKAAVGVPVIASLNATHAPAAGSATRGCIEEAGADALELNLYHVAADPRPDGRRRGGGRPRR